MTFVVTVAGLASTAAEAAAVGAGISAGTASALGTVAGVGAGATLGGAEGAALGATKAAISHEDVGKGALMGAATGAVGGGLAPGVSAAGSAFGTAGGALAGAGAGAAANAVGAMAGGKPVGKSALIGGITGGVLGGIAGSAGNAPAEGTMGPPEPAGVVGSIGGPNITNTQALMGLGAVGTGMMAQNAVDKTPEAPANVTPGLAPGLPAAMKTKHLYNDGTISGMGSIGMAGGGQVPVKNGAYIIPADVVSALGNGSSKAGAEFLRRLMDGVKVEATKRYGLGAARRAVA